jgi:hypothetical protein
MCKQEISPTLTMKVVEGACLTPPVLSRTQKCMLPPCSQLLPQIPQQHEDPRKSRWQVGHWGKVRVRSRLFTDGNEPSDYLRLLSSS